MKNNLNPLYRIDKQKYELIFKVLLQLDMSYLSASGGQKWEMDDICKGDKKLSLKYYNHWRNIYPKVEDMVINKHMFIKASNILDTDYVLVAIQNYYNYPTKEIIDYVSKEALYYYKLCKDTIYKT